MSPFDRVRRAVGAPNIIENETPPEALHTAKPEEANPGPADPQLAEPALPETMTKWFSEKDQLDRTHFYADYKRKDLLATADYQSISTKKQDTGTIKTLIAYAGAQGWSAVKLKGTEDFRREAWIEATARGIQATGHKPTVPEQQEAARRASQYGLNPASNEVQKEPQQSQQPAPVAAQQAAVQKNASGPSKSAKESGDRLALREGMTAAEHRAVTRAARSELSADGRLALTAVTTKIDKEMDLLNADAKAQLKAVAAVEMAKKEREQGPIQLTEQQRDQAKAPATPAQELETAKAHKAQLHSLISAAKSPVSDKTIAKYDAVSGQVDKLSKQQAQSLSKEPTKAPEPKPKTPAAEQKASPKREPEAPRRSRSIGR